MVFVGNKNKDYVSNDSPIVVYSTKGDVIYFHPNLQKRVKVISLPHGKALKSSNKFVIVSKRPINYPTFEELFKVFPPQNNFDRSKPIKVLKVKNEHVAQVMPTKHKILADKNIFKKMTWGERRFILAHERGHYYYNDEELCDLFAAIAVLRSGGNLYDCLSAQKRILKRSRLQEKRMMFLINNLKKYGKQ